MTAGPTAHDPASEPPTEHRLPEGYRRAPSVVVVNTGDGKGKSTAAFGTMLRAVARGWRVAVLQFVKSGDWRTGEQDVATRLGVDWWTLGEGFTWDSADLDHDAAVARHAWAKAREVIEAGAHELVVLDEITYPMTWGWIDTAEVVACLRDRPPHVNVIATGRDAPAMLVDAADTVTEMRKVKHAYDAGIVAKRGVDY